MLKSVCLVCLCLLFNSAFSQASGAPRVVLDVSNDQTTMAEEMALAMHDLGIIQIVGFVVTPEKGLKVSVINRRIKSFVTRLRNNSFSTPQVISGLKTPLVTYQIRKDSSSGQVQWKMSQDLLPIQRFLARVKLKEEEKIFYISQGRLSSLAYLLAQNPKIKENLHVVGNFAVQDPTKSVLSDRPAWRAVLSSGVSISTWNLALPENDSNDDQSTQNSDTESNEEPDDTSSPVQIETNDETTRLPLTLPLHPSRLADIAYSESLLAQSVWFPHSKDTFTTSVSDYSDPLLLGLMSVSHPDLFTAPQTYSTEPDDTELKVKFSSNSDGTITQYTELDVFNIGLIVMRTFDSYGQKVSVGIKPRVIVDGDFANGITDLAATLRLLYSSGIDLRGFCISSFAHSNVSLAKSQELSFLRLTDFLHAQFQLEEKVYTGTTRYLAGLRSNTPAMHNAKNFIIQEAVSTPADERLNVILLGSASNLALVLKSQPRLGRKIHVWLIGAIPSSDGAKWTPSRQNADSDPLAFKIVMNAPGLKRSILIPERDKTWIMEKAKYKAHLNVEDGGWLYLYNYWIDFVRTTPGAGIGLDIEKADFTEVALVELFLNRSLATRRTNGFSDLHVDGGNFWYNDTLTEQMNTIFLQSIGSTIFNQ